MSSKRVYFDFDWNKEKVYRVEMFRSFLFGMIGLTASYAPTIPYQLEYEKVRNLNNWATEVKFNTFSDYQSMFMWLYKSGSGFIIPADDYDGIHELLQQCFDKVTDENQIIYCDIDGNSSTFYMGQYTIILRVYRASGFYSTVKIPYTRSQRFNNREAFDIAIQYAENNGGEYNYCVQFMSACMDVFNYLHEVTTPSKVTLKYVQSVIDKYNSMGYNMCAYEIILWSGESKKTFLTDASQIIPCIGAENVGKIMTVQPIAFCRSDMVRDVLYRATFEDGSTIDFRFLDMDDFSKIFSRYLLRNMKFRVEEVI